MGQKIPGKETDGLITTRLRERIDRKQIAETGSDDQEVAHPPATQSLEGPIHRSTASATIASADPDSGWAPGTAPYDTGPDLQRLSNTYGINFCKHGQARKVQRLESDFGSETVQRWVDEGMTVQAMGKPRDMEAFRARQAGRSSEIPTDIERQNQASVQRNAHGQPAEGSAGDVGVPDAVRNVIAKPGTTMDESVQREMESTMGGDFSDVQLHTGPDAAAATEAINARAFTVGNHVAFNHGEYDPESESGKKVLAHELTHVRQQTGGRVSMLSKDQPLQIDPDPALEREANTTAEAVTADDQQCASTTDRFTVQRSTDGRDESPEGAPAAEETESGEDGHDGDEAQSEDRMDSLLEDLLVGYLNGPGNDVWEEVLIAEDAEEAQSILAAEFGESSPPILASVFADRMDLGGEYVDGEPSVGFTVLVEDHEPRSATELTLVVRYSPMSDPIQTLPRLVESTTSELDHSEFVVPDESATDATDDLLDAATAEPDWAAGSVIEDPQEVEMDPAQGLEVILEAFMDSEEGERIEELEERAKDEAAEWLDSILTDEEAEQEEFVEAWDRVKNDEDYDMSDFEAEFLAEDEDPELEELIELALETRWVQLSLATAVTSGLLVMYATDTDIPDDVIEEAKDAVDLEIQPTGSLTIEFDPEYSGVPFDPDEWGGSIEASYDLDGETTFISRVGYLSESADSEETDEYDLFELLSEVDSDDLPESDLDGGDQYIDVGAGFDADGESVSFDSEFELIDSLPELVEMEVNFAGRLAGGGDEDWQLRGSANYDLANETVDFDEYEETFGDSPDSQVSIDGGNRLPTDWEDDFESDLRTQLLSGNLTFTHEPEHGPQIEVDLGGGIGTVSDQLGSGRRYPQYEADLAASLETTRRFNAETSLALDHGPLGTDVSAELTSSLQLLDDLETNLQTQYTNAVDGTVDWGLAHEIQYQYQDLQLQLASELSDEEKRVMFSIGLDL